MHVVFLMTSNNTNHPTSGVASRRKAKGGCKVMPPGSSAVAAPCNPCHLSNNVLRWEHATNISESFQRLGVVQKLDDMISQDFKNYRQTGRQRCFKCRKYGHIAKDCKDVCKQCQRLHSGLCLFEFAVNLQKVIARMYGKFQKLHDQMVSVLNGKFPILKSGCCTNFQVLAEGPLAPRIKTKKHYETVQVAEERTKLVHPAFDLRNAQYLQTERKIKEECKAYAAKNNCEVKIAKYNIPDISSKQVINVNINYKKQILAMFSGRSLVVAQPIFTLQPYKLANNQYFNKEGDLLESTKIYKDIKMPVYERKLKPWRQVVQMRFNEVKVKLPQKKKKLEYFNRIAHLYILDDKVQQNNKELRDLENKKIKTLKDVETATLKINEIKEKYNKVKDEFKEKTLQIKTKYNEIKTRLVEETRNTISNNLQLIEKEKQERIQEARQQAADDRNKRRERNNNVHRVKSFYDKHYCDFFKSYHKPGQGLIKIFIGFTDQGENPEKLVITEQEIKEIEQIVGCKFLKYQKHGVKIDEQGGYFKRPNPIDARSTLRALQRAMKQLQTDVVKQNNVERTSYKTLTAQEQFDMLNGTYIDPDTLNSLKYS